VSLTGLTAGLCGAARPGHFDGVTTVVTRLFGLTRCDVACFGEKDFQQLAVIRRLVQDLALPVRIEPGPIVRDADGLALSSRNKFLEPDHRRRALSLRRAIAAVAMAWTRGVRDVSTLRTLGLEQVDADRVDYFEIVDASTLEPIQRVEARAGRALIAAFYGGTRLIDNGPVGPGCSWT
jgi:pantoate--beta-alanine ligase